MIPIGKSLFKAKQIQIYNDYLDKKRFSINMIANIKDSLWSNLIVDHITHELYSNLYEYYERTFR